jgi:hypothetical protein
MKPIGDFEVIDHGIEHEQYFQGCGTAFTNYQNVATGTGANFAEAIDDCLESIAQMDFETEGMEARILAEEFPGRKALPTKVHVLDCDESLWYYASIRWNEEGKPNVPCRLDAQHTHKDHTHDHKHADQVAVQALRTQAHRRIRGWSRHLGQGSIR